MAAMSFHLVVYSDSELLGGAEKSLATLVGNLSDDIRVTVMGVDRTIVDAVASARPGARTQIVPRVKAPWDLAGITAHVRAVRGLRPHIFHANAPSPWACEYGVAAALAVRGVRVMTVVHCPSPPTYWRQRRLAQLTSRRLAAHVAVGEASARELEEIAGLKPGSVLTIYNGVPDVAVARTNGDRPAQVLGWAGRLDDEKGIDILIRALADLPGVTTVLVGDGPKRAQLEALAEECGVADRVVFAGWQDTPQAILQGTDIFVLPSRIEAFPLSVLEAMLLELPVVASDVGSVSELVLSEETGVLVPSEDPIALARAVTDLLADPARRRQLGRRGREIVLERFTPQAMAREFESLYRRILE
jgi:glycosyltransferase involved in cell wall biosynthesis